MITGARSRPPVLVFTDGACEEDGTTVGGVLVDPESEWQSFGAKLSEATVSEWKTKLDQSQVIGQAEIFPLLLARLTWGHKLRGRRVIYFIDNEAARIGLVRAYSPVLPSLNLILSCLGWDYANNSQAWFARVSSYSNIADAPSRMEKLKADVAITIPPTFPRGHHPDVILS